MADRRALAVPELPTDGLWSALMPTQQVSDPTVEKALGLLMPFPGQVTYQTVPAPPAVKNNSAPAVAFVNPAHPGVVNVSDYSDVFKHAQGGDQKALKSLAAVLAHEQYHLTNGPGEGPAYDEQMRILGLLGAPKGAVKKVQAAKDYVQRVEGKQ